MVTIDGFDIFAFIVLAVLLITIIVLILVLGSLPGKIAAKRNHPQAKAINAASWISLFTVFTLWPIAFVWAFIQPASKGIPHEGGAEL